MCRPAFALVFAALVVLVLPGPAPAQTLPIAFEETSGAIPFVQQSVTTGGSGLHGAAWFDFDRDGDLDLYLANGIGHANALFRNDGGGVFVDVAAAAGVADGLGAAGVVAADVDNDGFQDLLVTGDGGVVQPAPPPALRLYHNRGDGTFADVTAASGLEGPPTQFSAAFADVDNDGDLDLFVAAPGTLVPPARQDSNRLYLNNGDLTFTDVSALSGVDTALGACVAFFSDYDDDGWIDLYVGDCNDVGFAATPIELFHNNGDLTFTDVAGPAGLAGRLAYWMGFAPGDFDRDGDVDLFVTSSGLQPRGFFAVFGESPHALFRNDGDGTYTDVGAEAGVALHKFGWGSVLTDFDDDGRPDLFFAGALPDPFGGFATPDGLANPGMLFANRGDGTFADLSPSLPHDFSRQFSSGVAAGDYDGDGFEDLVVAVSDVPGLTTSAQPVLLHNLGSANQWIKVELAGTVSNRDAVGARVIVTPASDSGSASGGREAKEVYAGSSMGSMHGQVLTFGLGAETRATVDVRWPSGARNRVYDVRAGSRLFLPEIPCSFDAPGVPFPAYRGCVAGALAAETAAGALTPAEAARLLTSAVRAYHESHAGG